MGTLAVSVEFRLLQLGKGVPTPGLGEVGDRALTTQYRTEPTKNKKWRQMLHKIPYSFITAFL